VEFYFKSGQLKEKQYFITKTKDKTIIVTDDSKHLEDALVWLEFEN